MQSITMCMLLLALMSTCCWAVDKADNDRVHKLFSTMRDGTYKEFKFPSLKWEDIPALMEIGKSKEKLKKFPVNSLSSQRQVECSEGMVALWLVEGLRKGGKDFPSLTALCLTEGTKGSNWDEQSAKNHDAVLAAYELWWKQVQTLPSEEAAKSDPLKGTHLHWH